MARKKKVDVQPIVRKYTKKVVTPIGAAVYPRLSRPDTKFKDEGEYSVNVRLEGEDAARFQQVVEDFLQEAHHGVQEEAGKKLKLSPHFPIKPVLDDDDEEIPGVVTVKCTLKASGKSKKTGKRWTAKPVVVDAKKNPVTEMVGAGSKIRVSGLLKAYYGAGVGGFGVSFQLRAVQVLDLVPAGGDFTDEFEEEEDGFTSSGDVSEDTETDEDDGFEDGEDDEDDF